MKQLPDRFSIFSLYKIIQDRKFNPTSASYTSSLLAAGEDEVLKKIGEEAIEVILAAKSQGKIRLIEEIADLTYHSLVLMALLDITPIDIEQELERRHS
jgi:phosphoribosyl-ATP pyrophosphohydrolase